MTTFTDKWLRGLKPADKGYEERDDGCPGLAIRVGKRGQKVWEVVVSHDGRRRRIRIGSFPDVSLAAARRKASELKGQPHMAAQPMRLRELWAMYEAEKAGSRRSWRDVDIAWRVWAEPRLGNLRLEDLSIRHGADLVAHVSRISSPVRARKIIAYLRPMLGFAVGRGLMLTNPWRDLALPDEAEARDRVLSVDEWTAVLCWARQEPYPWGPFLRMLMLTAQRLNEVAKMEWAELDLEAGLWSIPASRHKGKRGHEVPLTRVLTDLLDDLPRTGGFVFSTREGTPIAPGSKLAARIQKATDTSDWRLHDLRRTAATMMGDAGVERFVIERVLGHADAGVTARYDRATYREAKRRALEQVSW